MSLKYDVPHDGEYMQIHRMDYLRLEGQKKKLIETLDQCVDLLGELPTLNGSVGLAIWENAREVLEEMSKEKT